MPGFLLEDICSRLDRVREIAGHRDPDLVCPDRAGCARQNQRGK